MSYTENKAINIPKSHYVGFKSSGGTVPLGFMTPDGTDKAAAKRKSTVDNWARGYYYGNGERPKEIPASVLENKPMVGFKLGRNISGGGSGWNSRHDKWRIQDPRGFELEINSGNLEEIIRLSTLENGEILEPCIWARLGAENILLPTASDAYKNATANTVRNNTTGSVRDLVPGCKATLKNGTEIRFIGRVYVYGLKKYVKTEDYSRQLDLQTIFYPKTSYFAYYEFDKNGNQSKTINLKKSIVVSYIDTEETTPIEKMCEIANRSVVAGDHIYTSGNDLADVRILALLPTYDVDPVSIDRKLVSRGGVLENHERIAANKTNDAHPEYYTIVHVGGQGVWAKAYSRAEHKSPSTAKLSELFVPHYSYQVDEEELTKNFRPCLVYKTVQTNSWYSSRNHRQTVTIDFTNGSGNDLEFFSLIYTITLKNGVSYDIDFSSLY